MYSTSNNASQNVTENTAKVRESLKRKRTEGAEQKECIQKISAPQALQAAEDNDLDAIQQYIEQDGDLKITDGEGHNLLLLALMGDVNDKLVMALLEKGIEVTGTATKDEDNPYYFNVTPYLFAYFAYLNDKDIRCFHEMLKRKNIDLNATSDEGFQSETLHFGVTQFPHGMFPGIPPRAYTDGYALEKATLLHFAVVQGDIHTVKMLCETKRVNLQAKASLVHNKHLMNEENLLWEGMGEMKDGTEHLGTYFVCREPISASRTRDVTPLHLAARGGDYEMFQYLLSAKADLEAKDSSGKKPKDYFESAKEDLVIEKNLRKYEFYSEFEPPLLDKQLKDMERLEELFKGLKLEKRQKTYKSRLFLGEGNFSYLEALAKKHLKDKPNLASAFTGTEYESYNDLKMTHGEKFEKAIEFLKKLGAQIFFGIDATAIHQDQGALKAKLYRCIHFNFPHDRSNFRARTLPKLITNFFASASQIQKFSDHIHVALVKPRELNRRKFYEGYVYDIFTSSAKSGYVLIKKRNFGPNRYPGYQHAKTHDNQSASESESAREYIFEKRGLTYEEILAHKNYRPGGDYTAYCEQTHYLKELETDNDSSDYDESDDETPEQPIDSVSATQKKVELYSRQEVKQRKILIEDALSTVDITDEYVLRIIFELCALKPTISIHPTLQTGSATLTESSSNNLSSSMDIVSSTTHALSTMFSPNSFISSTSSSSSSFHATSGENAFPVLSGPVTSSELYQGIFNRYYDEEKMNSAHSSSQSVTQKAKTRADAEYQRLTQS